MTRIQERTSIDERVVAFSADGTRYAAVLWRGDLARNVNVYSLVVSDTKPSSGTEALKPVVSIESPDDTTYLGSTPMHAVTFLPDGQHIAFIGRFPGKTAQVYSVDVRTRAVHQLTSHPTPVRSFALDSRGNVRTYSATAPDALDSTRLAKIMWDGVSVHDRAVFPEARRFRLGAIALPQTVREVRQYFLISANGTRSVLYDSRTARGPAIDTIGSATESLLTGPADEGSQIGASGLSADPTGRYALLWPYARGDRAFAVERYAYFKSANWYVRRMAQPYGLVDLRTAAITPLIDAPRAAFSSDAAPVWSPSGRTVIVHTLLPLTGSAGDSAQAAPPQWVEVDITTRRITPLGLPRGWRVVRWESGGERLVVTRGSTVGVARRTRDGRWQALDTVGTAVGLSASYPSATNGKVMIGVRDSLTTPPELASFDLTLKSVRTLSDLNPSLRARSYGEATEITWRGKFDSASFGYLVKPVGFVSGRRYPLVVLFKDENFRPGDHSFLIDGQHQLSGFAIQPLAAAGFVVLYTPSPPSVASAEGSTNEGQRIIEHVRSAVAHLDGLGLIDTTRVALSGFSRAAFYTDYVAMHAPIRLATIVKVDGGGRDYIEGRPFRDEELRRLSMPMLIENHGSYGMAVNAAMGERLEAFGTPVEQFYFAAAPHNATLPQHRWRSLSINVDWYRFWLQQYEDSDTTKREQYARWRAMSAKR